MFKGRTLKVAVVAAALAGIVCVAGGFAAAGGANVTSDYAEGKITLKKYANSFDERNFHVVECGDTVRMEVKLYVDEFFGRNTVMANPTFTNPTSTPRHVSFHIALVNSRGELVGCASQNSGEGVDPNGGTLSLGSCIISLEPEEIESIRKYQIRVYESNEEVGAAKLMASH